LRKLIKILGILFSLATVVIAISFFIDKGFNNQLKLSWMLVTMCAALIFNGVASYLTKKDKQGPLSVGVGIIILIFVIIKFRF
jgi:predicted phage tail protein